MYRVTVEWVEPSRLSVGPDEKLHKLDGFTEVVYEQQFPELEVSSLAVFLNAGASVLRNGPTPESGGRVLPFKSPGDDVN